MENKIMPLVENIVHTTRNFDEKISDIKSKQDRMDELILDKCSKYDLKKFERRIDSMVEIEN